MMHETLAKLLERRDLDSSSMESAMESILRGEATDAQLAALLVALRMKGETSEELAAAARVMRRHCRRVEAPRASVVLDTCGTGGDGSGSFNVSTLAAVVVASEGVMVAKHGNRAVSSKSGSADVVQALGIPLDLEPEAASQCLAQAGICFLFAQRLHPAMRHAGPVRRELGVRTMFNLLGPLTNPADATHQLLGVYDPARLMQVAETLQGLGRKGAWVVHGAGGLDEVSTLGCTEVVELRDGHLRRLEVRPEDFGVARADAHSLVGGDAERNAAIARAILDGEGGAIRDAVVANAAAAFCVAGLAGDPREGAKRAEAALDSGRAKARFEAWKRVAQGLASVVGE